MRVGSVERRISIVEPLLRHSGEHFENGEGVAHWPVVVGPGDWILLGSDAREAYAVHNAYYRESLTSCELFRLGGEGRSR